MSVTFYVFFRSEKWKAIKNWSQIILVIIHHKHKWKQTVLEVLISTFVYLYLMNLPFLFEHWSSFYESPTEHLPARINNFGALWDSIDSFVMIPCPASYLTTKRRSTVESRRDAYILSLTIKCSSFTACYTERWWLQYFLDIFWEHIYHI